MTRSKWLRSIGAAALAVSLIWSGSASAEAKKIKIGYDVVPIHLAPLIFNLGPDVLKNKGKTYTPDLIRFRGSAHQLAALAAGELDIAVLAFSTLAAGIVNAKQDIVAIADVAQDGPGFSSVYAVLDKSPIKSVKDLKGKSLAINAAGGAVDMAARVVVEKNGLKPGSDVVILESGFGAMEAMLREGKTDVAVFIAPFWARASAKGGVRPLFHQRDGLGTTQFLLYAAKRDFVKNNRALLVDVMEDYIRGIRWLTDPARLCLPPTASSSTMKNLAFRAPSRRFMASARIGASLAIMLRLSLPPIHNVLTTLSRSETLQRQPPARSSAAMASS